MDESNEIKLNAIAHKLEAFLAHHAHLGNEYAQKLLLRGLEYGFYDFLLKGHSYMNPWDNMALEYNEIIEYNALFSENGPHLEQCKRLYDEQLPNIITYVDEGLLDIQKGFNIKILFDLLKQRKPIWRIETLEDVVIDTYLYGKYKKEKALKKIESKE